MQCLPTWKKRATRSFRYRSCSCARTTTWMLLESRLKTKDVPFDTRSAHWHNKRPLAQRALTAAHSVCWNETCAVWIKMEQEKYAKTYSERCNYILKKKIGMALCTNSRRMCKKYKNCTLDELYILAWYCGHRLGNMNKKVPKTLENLPIERKSKTMVHLDYQVSKRLLKSFLGRKKL